ncbi:MAG: Mur ligase family protein [Methanobacteriaceae archaeon]|nr:Mur ligase family protein [Methanobacteriaceae archaeon]
MENNDIITAQKLANKIEGTLYGSNKELTGDCTFLNQANENDIVIRHWINAKGVEIAHNKKVSCLITQDPQDNAIQTAEKLDLPLIVTKKIELATAAMLNIAVNKYAKDANKIAISGTNGKSTVSHLLYTIYKDLNYNTYTNTDAESEGNTLIDPRVSSEITNYYKKYHYIDTLVIEVSEVQGWFDRLMEKHAYYMISSLEADSLILTNLAMDHIGIVESFEQIKEEITIAIESLNQQDKKTCLVLNNDDDFIKSLENKVNDNVEIKYFGKYNSKDQLDIYYKDGEGIFSDNELLIKEEDLPFNLWHFIQDIMAALCICKYNQLPSEDVVKSIKNYTPLERRFKTLKEKPLILDDYAHNPSGIIATIENSMKKTEEHTYIINAIRGSRGIIVNKQNAEAIVEVLSDKKDYSFILTSSVDVTDRLNKVESEEKEEFLKVLENNNINYTHINNLEKALVDTINKANVNDLVLLIGAQGMDPASNILKNHNII